MKWTASIYAALLAAALMFGASAAAFGAGNGYTLTWGYSEENVGNVPDEALSNATDIVAGYYHTLALVGGNVCAWGTTNNNVTNVDTRARAGTATAIAAGEMASAAIVQGEIVAWGGDIYFRNNVASNDSPFTAITVGTADENSRFSFGVGLTEEEEAIFWPSDTSFTGSSDIREWGTGVKQVSAGRMFAMGLKNGGVLVAGSPKESGTNTYGVENVPLAAKSGVQAIAAGPFHCMALRTNGEVVVWGARTVEQAEPVVPEDPTGLVARAAMPRTAFGNVTNVPPEAQSDVVAIAAGYNVCAALRADGRVVIWGSEAGTGGQIMEVPAFAREGVRQVTLGKQHVVVRTEFLPPRFVTTGFPEGYLQTEYSAQVEALADPAATYSFQNAALCPPGLTMSPDGVFSGVPMKMGTNSFSIVASNAYGATTNAFFIFVNERQIPPPEWITTNLPAAQYGFLYEAQLEATENPTFLFDTSTGYELPPGLTLSPSGLLSGIPTQIGQYYPTLIATNVTGEARQQFTISVVAPTDVPVIGATSPLPNAQYPRVTYSNDLAIDGATNVWISAGSENIPGLRIEKAGTSWYLYGNAEVQGDDLAFTIAAANAAGMVESNFVITIDGPPVWLTPTNLPDVQVFEPCEIVLQARWATNYAKASGNYPSGLSGSVRTNGEGQLVFVISGTPWMTGTETPTIRAENAQGRVAQTFTLTVVNQAPPPEYQFLSITRDGSNAIVAWTNKTDDDTTAYLLSTTNLLVGWPTNTPASWGDTVTSPATVPMSSSPTYFLLRSPNGD